MLRYSSAGTDSLRVKIRLNEGAQARIWIADACLTPAADAYVVPRSASYLIALAQVPGQGANACLASSDSVLAASVPVTGR